jgi:phenylalanyl-tRNA synthetase alpha chain
MDIEAIQISFDSEIRNINTAEALEALRIKYLGRKGLIAQLTAKIPSLAHNERAAFGQQVNNLKNKITSLIAEKQRSLSLESAVSRPGSVDIGLPGIAQEVGRLHLLTQVIDEICSIFKHMGFSVVEGPEIETILRV